MSTPLVEVVRSALVDGIHRRDLAVVDADGRMVAAVGEPRHKIAFWRSAAKPFQALPTVYTGAAENRGPTSEDLGLIAGSHSGEKVHVERASAVLGRIGGLHQLGVLHAARMSRLAAHARPALRTVDGDPVGDARPVFALDSARDDSEAPA